MTNGAEPFPNVPLSNVIARPIEPGDTERLLRLFQRLSPETIYRRFFTLIPTPPPATLRRLATVDHHDREALVALSGDDIVAVARWDCAAAGAHEAEIAVVVEDLWQHRGLGHLLLQLLATEAARQGITVFTATVLSNNRAAIRLATSIGKPSEVQMNGPETRLVFPLAS